MPQEVTGTSCMLVVTGRGGQTFVNSSSIEIKTKTLSLFVQTDKAIYKPGQKGLPSVARNFYVINYEL